MHVAGILPRIGREFLRGDVVGHEDEDRAAEPRFAAEPFEEAPEGHVVVGHAPVDSGVALRKRRGVPLGNDERMVRREGEQRGEERFV